ncbi:hypothetical protein [Kyrpidia tusciae]|uniref:hypothetical protein n=1 Tax=Kyrpidia tusciae TaxID=33943 RepID=UPI00030213B8|nr:hypothetical protein [Kyrpidia tusciae]
MPLRGAGDWVRTLLQGGDDPEGRGWEIGLMVSGRWGEEDGQVVTAGDLLTIITVFSARMYGKRSQEFRKKIGQAMNEMGGEGTGQGHQDDPDRDSQGGPSVQEGGVGEDQGHL